MEKRDLYILIIVIIAAVLILFSSKLTGKGTIGECIDTDNGKNPETPGSVSFTNAEVIYKDECYSKGDQGYMKYLKERFCHVEMENQLYYCEDGCVENEKGEGYCPEGEANPMY